IAAPWPFAGSGAAGFKATGTGAGARAPKRLHALSRVARASASAAGSAVRRLRAARSAGARRRLRLGQYARTREGEARESLDAGISVALHAAAPGAGRAQHRRPHGT